MKLKITVHGVAYEVDVEVLDAGDGAMQQGGPLPPAPPIGPTTHAAPAVAPAPGPAGSAGPVPAAPAAAPSGDGGGVASPIAGTVLEVKCKPGQKVAHGDELLVIEAMKMETSIAAPSDGTIKSILVAAGDSVRENQTLVEFE